MPMAAPNVCPITRVLSGLAREEVSAKLCSQNQPPASSSSTTIRPMTRRVRFDMLFPPKIVRRRITGEWRPPTYENRRRRGRRTGFGAGLYRWPPRLLRSGKPLNTVAVDHRHLPDDHLCPSDCVYRRPDDYSLFAHRVALKPFSVGTLYCGRMRIAVALALLGMAFLTGCADVPGSDGRYATHDHGANNREGGRGLPATPYVPR